MPGTVCELSETSGVELSVSVPRERERRNSFGKTTSTTEKPPTKPPSRLSYRPSCLRVESRVFRGVGLFVAKPAGAVSSAGEFVDWRFERVSSGEGRSNDIREPRGESMVHAKS